MTKMKPHKKSPRKQSLYCSPAALRATVCLGLLASTFAAGCGATPPASFRTNMVMAAKQRLTTEQERQVATIVEAMFGTPDEPVALPETGLDVSKLQLAAGPVRSDIVGRKNGLYREHCVHCHGTTGDGLGPTAAFLNPYPRDYRPGVFKFKSTERADKPTHADLARILHNGIVGTSMPSFALLGDAQVDALVEYVKYLSMRGETEIALMQAFFDLDDYAGLRWVYGKDGTYLGTVEAESEEAAKKEAEKKHGEGVVLQGKLPETREFVVDEVLAGVAEKWKSASDASIAVPEMPSDIDLAASIAKGKELFHGDKANCVKCHGVTALGDGQANDYDDWNKAVVEFGKEIASGREQAAKTSTAEMSPDDLSEHRATLAWLEKSRQVLDGDALRPRTIPPRNLRQAIYRGGRRPLDLYYRIHAGINGAPMPAAKGTIPPEEIWHIVNYIRSLPYEFDGELGADKSMVASGR